MRVAVFLHGTAIMHRSGVGVPREERVRQVLEGKDSSIRDFASYVPVGHVVAKLQTWQAQGAEIVYLSSHRKAEDVQKDASVLRKYGFPDGQVFYRQSDETYGAAAERAMPDVLIEDDCESLGGETEMTYPQIREELKARIKSIVVSEFGGIDHLPDDVRSLTNCCV
jgi:hypothetical protein